MIERIHRLELPLGLAIPLVLMVVGKLVEIRGSLESGGLAVFGLGAVAGLILSPLVIVREGERRKQLDQSLSAVQVVIAVALGILAWWFLSFVFIVNFHLWLGGSH